MWGGVKARGQYGELFSRWVPSRGLDELRAHLPHEPRPWFVAYELHRRNHLLPDHHCARLLSWCTTVMQLRRGLSEKQEAYHYAQNTFAMMVRHHKAGPLAFAEYMRLCAVGRDLSSAFRWYNYWLETNRDGASSLRHCTWLLRLASLSPSDERAEDMVAAVRQVYEARLGSVDAAPSGTVADDDDDDGAQKRELEAAFRKLAPRVQDTVLRAFVDALPVTADAARAIATGWPGKGYGHVFPHLEHGVAAPSATLATPRLRDSLLHGDLVDALETAAFAHDVRGVMALMRRYAEEVRREASTTLAASGEQSRHSTTTAASLVCWRHAQDSTARYFRRELLKHGDGFSAELYHYLVVALAPRNPSAALRTLQRMRAAGLRVLDLTRTVALVAAREAWDEQLALFQEQLREIAARRQLDADYGITKEVELYWKYNYTLFLHYRNALDEEDFYALLLDGLGVRAVQQLVLAARVHGVIAEHDLVLVDDALRRAAVRHFRRSCVDAATVQAAMDAITTHMPKLDLALISTVPHFTDYVLDADDDIATDTQALRATLQPYDIVYLLDTSFVETSEHFVDLGATAEEAQDKVLVLVPYVVLAQLARSIELTHELVTMDPELQDDVRAEPLLASQRLRALYAMLRQPSRSSPRRTTRVLHFTESLLAHAAPALLARGTPSTNDDDHCILLAAMLRSLTSTSTRVIVCTDDPALRRGLEAALAGLDVSVMSTAAPDTVDVGSGLVNDNPDLGCDAEFSPRLDFIAAATAPVTDNAASVTDDAVVSPWMALLQDEPSPQTTRAVNETAQPGPSQELPRRDAACLMELYESPHEVVPVGVKMREASALTSVFDQFDTTDPDRDAAGQTPARPPRPSLLFQEALRERGMSNKERFRLARSLSNQVGGRVPFHLRFRRVQANVLDPRNRPLYELYERGVAAKRAAYKRSLQKGPPPS